MVDSEEVGENEFSIQWITKDNQEIIISDNDQLEEIYLMHNIVEKHGLPNFRVIAKFPSSNQLKSGT